MHLSLRTSAREASVRLSHYGEKRFPASIRSSYHAKPTAVATFAGLGISNDGVTLTASKKLNCELLIRARV